MKIQELRNLSVEDLMLRLDQLREGLFKGRVRAATKELDNVMMIRNTRRNIARILTVLRQKGVKV